MYAWGLQLYTETVYPKSKFIHPPAPLAALKRYFPAHRTLSKG